MKTKTNVKAGKGSPADFTFTHLYDKATPVLMK
jgi:type VI protein secretion system component Hcp